MPHRMDSFTGPLGISPNQRYFTDGKGKPWFWQGDTLWELFRMNTAQDARAIVEKRISQGFNAFQIMLNGVPDGNEGIAGVRPWVDNNPSDINETYFGHVDPIIRLCDELGVVFVVGVYHKSEAPFFSLQTARQYARFAAGRYSDIRNIVWSIYPVAGDSSTAICRGVAAGLAEGDGGTHLITVHPDPSPASSSWLQSEPWLAFNTIQTFSSGRLNYQMTSDDYRRTPTKPVVMGEARYETADGTTPLDIRRGACWSILAGGFYSYGHTNNWESPTTWQEWVDTPGANQMGVIGGLFRSLDWWNLVPDQSVIAGDPGDKAAARSSDGCWALIYMPSPGEVSVTMAWTKAGAKSTATWLNPANGESKNAGSQPAGSVQSYVVPDGWEDALLLIRVR